MITVSLSFLLLHTAIKFHPATSQSPVCFNPSIDTAVKVNDNIGPIGKCVYAFGPMEYQQILNPGEFLCDSISPDTKWAFGLKKGPSYDVVLVNVKSGEERVISDDGKEGCYLIMQGDGNLVLKDRNAKGLWKSGTAQECGAKLYVRCFGEVQIVSIDGEEVLWKERQSKNCVQNYLFYDAKLKRGEYICYDNQYFGMTENGNLVYYEDKRLIWSRDTGDKDAEYLKMKRDGDLVAYDDDDDRVWETGTTSSQMNMDMRGASLILDYKGVYIKTSNKNYVFWWEW